MLIVGDSRSHSDDLLLRIRQTIGPIDDFKSEMR